MSQGFDWPSYISTCSDAVELSLLRCIRFDGRISFNDLLRATDMKLAPRYVWYKLHDDLVMRSKVHNLDDLWSTKIIAWGLNIWEADLIYLYRSVVQELALRRRGTLSRVRPGELPVERAGTCTSIYSMMEDALQGMSSRFINFPGEDLTWRLKALSQMALICWRTFITAKKQGFYDDSTGVLTELGVRNWRRLSAQAENNDRAYGFPAEPALKKRKAESGNELDQEGNLPKRSKRTRDSTSIDKRKLEGDDENDYDGHQTAKRIKTAQPIGSDGKRPREDEDEIENEHGIHKRQAFGR